MKRKIILAFCLLVLSTAGYAEAGSGTTGKKQEFVISVDWLQNHTADKNLVLLHVGRKEDFEKEHIPGALYISTRDVSTTREENELTLELPPVERLRKKFESFGISNDSRVVLYWGKDWVTPTTRVFFTFDYLGLADKVSILNGGMPAWEAAGNPVTAELRQPEKGVLKVKTRDVVAKKKDLADAILNDNPITIIDARDSKYYTGEDKGSMPRGGHIPNAQNIPYSTLLTEDLKFKPIQDLELIFREAGAKKKDPVVTYCHIGQQASLAYFVARMLGYEVRIYDGSFQEWSKSEQKVVVRNKGS